MQAFCLARLLCFYLSSYVSSFIPFVHMHIPLYIIRMGLNQKKNVRLFFVSMKQNQYLCLGMVMSYMYSERSTKRVSACELIATGSI